jgi:4-cresol dehydrogenase (hydroxylating)
VGEYLPAGMHPAALLALQEAVGECHVAADPASLSTCRDPYSVLDNDPYVPAAVVSPGSAGEVQEVVRLANLYGFTLWPVSRGKNLAYGGPAPGCPGSVLVELSRMDRILEVSERDGYAVVEPGVTYDQLHRHLQETGSGYWADVPDLAWGSVLANALERGNGYTPFGDHWGAACGLEVVLPDGELLRTGMGALPGSRTWHTARYGYGPLLDGLFSQSNLGITVKMGIQLMPRPAGYRPYMIILPGEEQIGPAAGILRRLRMTGVIQNTATARSVLLEAAAAVPRSRYSAGSSPVPPGLLPEIMRDQDIGHWNLYAAQYGPPPVMNALMGEIRAQFAVIPGARVCFLEDRPAGSVLAHRAARMSGRPGMEDLQVLRWPGPAGGHINVSPVSPASSEDALRQYELASRLCREYGLDYLGDIIVNPRELHHIVMICFDTGSAEQRHAALALSRRLVLDAARAGYGVYRTHVALMDLVAQTYSWGGGAQMRTLDRLKRALDPNGILAPGKQGVRAGAAVSPDPLPALDGVPASSAPNA